MASFDDNNELSVGDPSPRSSSTTRSRFAMHSSVPSALERRNEMHLADETADDLSLSADEVAIIFSFLPPKDIMHARVCTTWREAAKKTLVPLTEFVVASARSYNAITEEHVRS